jgi:hypothetical protein
MTQQGTDTHTHYTGTALTPYKYEVNTTVALNVTLLTLDQFDREGDATGDTRSTWLAHAELQTHRDVGVSVWCSPQFILEEIAAAPKGAQKGGPHSRLDSLLLPAPPTRQVTQAAKHRHFPGMANTAEDCEQELCVVLQETGWATPVHGSPLIMRGVLPTVKSPPFPFQGSELIDVDVTAQHFALPRSVIGERSASGETDTDFEMLSPSPVGAEAHAQLSSAPVPPAQDQEEKWEEEEEEEEEGDGGRKTTPIPVVAAKTMSGQGQFFQVRGGRHKHIDAHAHMHTHTDTHTHTSTHTHRSTQRRRQTSTPLPIPIPPIFTPPPSSPGTRPRVLPTLRRCLIGGARVSIRHSLPRMVTTLSHRHTEKHMHTL